MNTTDILDAIRTSIAIGEIAEVLRGHVSSPVVRAVPMAWLSADVIQALDTLLDTLTAAEAHDLVDALHAIV